MLTTLAQSQAAGLNTHFSLVKIIIVLVLFILWTLASQWVDRDSDRVKTRREWWNFIVLGGGVGGLAVLLLFPWAGAGYFLGLAFWAVLGGGPLVAYVVHRNGRVAPHTRVMNAAHFKRLIGSGGGKKKRVDKGLRVRVVSAKGEMVEKPSDPTELDQFDATQDFLFDAMWKRASDVDVVIGAESTRVIYKIDGVASEQENALEKIEADKVIEFLKRQADLNIEERRRPQTGTIKVGLLGSTDKPEPMEVQTSGSTQGERLRLRLNRSAGLMKLEDLGFSEKPLKQFKAMVELDMGLVVFAGPKESGITTTQYATIRAHDAYLQNLYTLETKPLMKLENVTQQVYDSTKADVSFARMLQTVIRREPDVVAVSQCEDRETAQVACRSAVEKKIYLGLKASNCIDAVSRLLALAEDPKLVAGSLVGVVAQRLLRILCPACREAYQPDDQLVRKANLPADKIEHFYRPPSAPILDKRGREIICQTCQNSRYVGRTGVFELLVISDKLRELIAAGAPIKQIKDQARTEKMRYLQEQGLFKVIDGTTSMAEVMRSLKIEGK